MFRTGTHIFKLLGAFILALGCVPCCTGQESVIDCSDSLYCIPTVSGLPRGKGFLLERYNTMDRNITSRSLEDGREEQAGIRKNRTYTLKMRGPVINKDHMQLVVGISATFEEFEFEKDESQLNDPLLKTLNDRSLRTMGLDLYSMKPFKSNKYLVSRLQTRLNGDFDKGTGPLYRYLRFNYVSVLGWKLNDHETIAFGAAFSHIYGRASVLPVFIYYNSFHPKWGLEANLPANARLRYSPSDKWFLYAGAKVRGANYRLGETEEFVPFVLEKSELDMGLTIEREIYDWLWVGGEIGYQVNLSMEVFSDQRFLAEVGDLLVETDIDNAPYFGLSVFLVTPKKYLKNR